LAAASIKLNRETRLKHGIVRSLVLAVEPRLVDTLIQHAQGGSTTPVADEKKESETKPAVTDEPETSAPSEVKEPALTPAEATASAGD